MGNPLVDVQRFGQSIWFDNIRRNLVTSGELKRMVAEDGLLGITSNPAIFEKAIAGSGDYDEALRALVEGEGGDAKDLYEALAIEDIQCAADVLRPAYEGTDGRDGYVSLEVSPHLSHDTKATIEEGARLFASVGRDNVMIKVPATPEGIPAVAELIAQGIHVNVTLLFSISTYQAAANAYMSGLERWIAGGGDPRRVSSVASFFLSRIDTLIDQRIEAALDATTDKARRARLKGLVGKLAVASAKSAYAVYEDLLRSERWAALAAKGARSQRLLWASTSTKNPKYPRTMYVDSLIGPDTVNTLPAETFDAYRTEGAPALSLTEGLEEAEQSLADLAEEGISLADACEELLADGVRKFIEPFDKLLAAVERKRREILGTGLGGQSYSLGTAEGEVRKELARWREEDRVRRLWRGDASLWTGQDESYWLGWLHAADGLSEHLKPLQAVVEEIRTAGFTDVLLLGMGGSSLCPLVLRDIFGTVEGYPRLTVLDSVVPAEVRTAERSVDPDRTLFVVSSKSGATIEPSVLLDYFFTKAGRDGSRFVAITDPGTPLHQRAKNGRFRHIFFGIPDVGGRFSALTNFGLVPAALAGLDTGRFLESAEIMVQTCAPVVPPDANDGVILGTILGVLARKGVDKLTLIVSPALASLGAWLEQLVAESTGKDGKGIVPVEGEAPAAPDRYDDDRVFVYVRASRSALSEQDEAVGALEHSGAPVVRIEVAHPLDLGQEFFRWEMAAAVAGSILGIHPFDQPDVEAAKAAARSLTEEYERTGSLPREEPVFAVDGIHIYADDALASDLRGGSNLENCLRLHLDRLRRGDYFALNSFLPVEPEISEALRVVRGSVRDAKRVATTVGHGPRYLHSTGQLHKGGPNRGVFIVLTAEDEEDLAIPGRRLTFGALKTAQARGDVEVLRRLRRRVLRLHFGREVKAGLQRLCEATRSVLAGARV